MATLNLLSYDLGASNGRGMLGRFDGDKLSMRELSRFENGYVDIGGLLYWDILGLYNHMHKALRLFAREGVGELHAVGIDTWAVDYGLLDEKGRLLGNPLCYRNALPQDAAAVHKVVPPETLFARTGIAALDFNTVYQLYRRKLDGDPLLDCAHTLLMIPDLLGYFFTGEKRSEYTNATATMLYDPAERNWDYPTIRALGLPERIFTKVDQAGTLRGALLPGVLCGCDIGTPRLAAVGTHDTASAVAAIPARGSFAFCSSGTWSLFGVETDRPLMTNDAFEAGFSNEGTVQGGFRPLKNIMGLWIVQECRREWLRQGPVNWCDIVTAAGEERPLRSIIDPDHPAFFNSGGMVRKVQDYCRATNQPVPEGVGQIARCIYESLALKYRWAMERLESIKGQPLDALHIVGGGMKNELLNQMAADAVGKPVITGPAESACIGNLLMQAVALGELSGIEDVRQVVRNSVAVATCEPHRTQAWEDAYGKLLALMKTDRGKDWS
jgi:rhamnulokinase